MLRGRISLSREPPDSRLGCREPGNRDAVGRAAHVVEPGLGAKLDRGRVAAVLAADTHLETFPGCPALRRCYFDEPPNSFRIEYREGVRKPDLLLDVGIDDLAAVVAREPERRLRQVVGSEAEKLGTNDLTQTTFGLDRKS